MASDVEFWRKDRLRRPRPSHRTSNNYQIEPVRRVWLLLHPFLSWQPARLVKARTEGGKLQYAGT